MYKKAHRRLTFLFTGIAGLILIIMSICYLYMSEKELKSVNYLSFLSESNTIISNLEQQTTITHNWLTNVTASSSNLLAIYDNDHLLSYCSTTLNERQQLLAATVLSKGKEHLATSSVNSDYQTTHADFSYTDDDRTIYYANVANLSNHSTPFYIVILSSTELLESQLKSQQIRFLLIDMIGIFLLLLFSHTYTKRLLSPLQQNQEKQNAFIAAVSHELRTPLAVILSSNAALKQSDEVMRKKFLKTIDNESRRMSTLINDMLLLAKADNHCWNFCMKETELDTLLLNSYEAFLPLAHEKKIDLKIAFPEADFSPCICDPERISQVLDILLSNAISYGKKGGYIKLSLSYCAPYYNFFVEDNGVGISDDAKPYIFDRFYREDTSRSKKDHFGLGLSIAKEIVNAHHGKISISNTPGSGTTFTLMIPTQK